MRAFRPERPPCTMLRPLPFSDIPSSHRKSDGAGVHAWYGLRYALSHQRFAPAQPATGRLDATALPQVPVFPQMPSRLAAAMGHGCSPPQSEDAFYVNLWAPDNAEGLPVLVFIHGGAWMSGGGSLPWYDGTRLAAQGLVVVNVNYRIGPFGHLGQADAHPLPVPATDLLLALEWVGEHIHRFGGNAAKTTLMGQSAGGWYAHLLSVLPQTQGWFQRVALLSMGTRSPWTPVQQRETTDRALALVGGDWDKAATEAVLKAGMAALAKEPTALGHAPSAFLPVASAGLPPGLLDTQWAATQSHVDAVYLRTTQDESAAMLMNLPEQRNATQAQVDAALSAWPLADLPPALVQDGHFCGWDSRLSPYRQLVAASSWRQFQRFPTEYAAALAQRGRKVQQSHFTTESPLDGLYSGHCLDLPFQFGNRADWADAPMLSGLAADTFEAVSAALIAEIRDFVVG